MLKSGPHFIIIEAYNRLRGGKDVYSSMIKAAALKFVLGDSRVHTLNLAFNTIMRYNHYFETQGSEKFAMEKYAGLRTAKADLCRDCPGICESSCPLRRSRQGAFEPGERSIDAERAGMSPAACCAESLIGGSRGYPPR